MASATLSSILAARASVLKQCLQARVVPFLTPAPHSYTVVLVQHVKLLSAKR